MEPDDGSLDALDTLSRITPVHDPPDWADHKHMRGPGYHKSSRSVATEKSRDPSWSDNIDQYIDSEFEEDGPEEEEGDDDLNSLTSMDTETFRRLRNQRRSNYKSSDSHYREHNQRGGGGGGSTISSGGSSRLLKNGKQPRGGYASSDTEVTKNSKSNSVGNNSSSVARRRNASKNGGRGHYTDGDIEDQRSQYSNSTASSSRGTSISDRFLRAIKPRRSKNTTTTTNTSRRSKRASKQSRFPWTILLICLSFVGILKSGMVELKLEQNMLNTILRGSEAVDELNYRRNTYYTKPNVAAAAERELEKVIDQMLEEDEDGDDNENGGEGEGKGIMDGGVLGGGGGEYSNAIMPAEDVDQVDSAPVEPEAPPLQPLVASPVVLEQQQIPMQGTQLLPPAMGAIGTELQSNLQQLQVQQAAAAVDPLLTTNGIEQTNAINAMGQPQEQQQTQEQLLQVQIQQLQLLQQQGQQMVLPQPDDQASTSLQGDSLSSLPDLTPLLQPDVQKEPERLPSYHIPPERLPSYHIPQVFIQPQQPQQQDEVPLQEVLQVDQSEQQQTLSDVQQQQQQETIEQFQQPEQQETIEQFQQPAGEITQPNPEQLDSNIDVPPNPEQLESNNDVQPNLPSFLVHRPNGAPKIMKRKATFIGCYVDAKDRDLPFQVGSGFTHEQCYQGCSAQGYAYFGMQYEGDCRCGNSYGKYGPNKCVNDCSPDATFFGKWINCVYDISTNAKTPTEHDPSLVKDESEIEPNTDSTNAISQQDSSVNVDEPPSEVYFRQSLENMKNVNLNPKVQARNSNGGEEEEQIVGESDVDMLSDDPLHNDSHNFRKQLPKKLLTDEEKDQLNQEGASDTASAEEGNNSNQERLLDNINGVINILENDREEEEDDSRRQRNPKAGENREARSKRIRRRKSDKEVVVSTDGVDNMDAKDDGAEEEEGNKGDSANGEGRNENTTEEEVVKEE